MELDLSPLQEIQDEAARDLLQQVLQKNPDHHPTWQAILGHKWFTIDEPLPLLPPLDQIM